MRRLSVSLASLLAIVSMLVGTAATSFGVSTSSDVHIAAFDNYYVPSSPVVPRGVTVFFDFDSAKVHHTATDDSDLALYDSGDVAGGGPSFSYTFVAAGTYPFYCVFHPEMRGRVRVPMRVTPGHGPKGTIFTLTWASAAASPGYAYDVQLRRPGGTWASLRTATLAPSATFQPHSRGMFRFRARLHDTTTSATSDWSDRIALKVV